MWTRQHDSWWRISWLMTKACLMRRAMETVSNWTRRLWLLRASRAAANTQSIRISHPPPLGGIQPAQLGLWLSGPQRNRNCCRSSKLWDLLLFAPVPVWPSQPCSSLPLGQNRSPILSQIYSNCCHCRHSLLLYPTPLEHRIFIIVCHTSSFIPEACCSLCLPESLWRPGLNHTWERVQAKQKIEKHKLQRNQ